MPRNVAAALFALVLSLGLTVPVHASITTPSQKSMQKPTLKVLADSLVQQPDLQPSPQDFDVIRKRAQSGDAHAQTILGAAYLYGTDVPHDKDKGLHWLQLAADQGYHDGMALLGAYLVFDGGNTTSHTRGLVYLKNLALHGQPHDIAVYGIALLSSAGPTSKWSEGFAYLQKAAKLGDPLAPLMLGAAYSDGHGVSWNPFKAVHWYKEALKYPMPAFMSGLAQYQLGVAYLSGSGVAKDEARAVAYMRKAIDAGNADAAFSLSLMYRNGNGVPKDAAKARQWLLTAARRGSPGAQFMLGMHFTLERKTHRDYKQGIPWLERAAHHGYAQAYTVLGIMHQFGMGFPVDDQAAAKQWMQAAKLGDGAAAFMVAHIWVNQHDKEGDTYAVMWLAIAEQLGFSRAKPELDDLAKRFRKSVVQKGLLMAQAWLKVRTGK
jgi:TPR repeat protein